MPFQTDDDENDEEPPSTQEEIDLLKNLEEYFDTNAAAIATPRTQMRTLRKDQTVTDAVKLVLDSGYSRIPVHDQNRDNILGVLFAVDLFKYIIKSPSKAVQEVMRPALFVSFSKPIHQLLSEFKQKNMHMAFVVDEYGGVDGMVTVTDIIEELVGDIPEESNQHPEPSWEQIDQGQVLMDADFNLDEFNKLYRSQFEKEGIETIGGYICHSLGKIPDQQEAFSLAGIGFVVDEATDRRLTKLRITSPKET